MEKIQNTYQLVKCRSRREKVLFFFVVLLSVAFLVFLICLMTSKSGGEVCYTPECILDAHHILQTVDQTVDPCEDFHKFACGNFLKNAIANDEVSPLKSLDAQKTNVLQQLLMEDRNDEQNLTKSFRDQRKFFRACMNTTAIEQDGDQTFLEDVKYVTGGWPLSLGYASNLFWPEVMVRAREKGLWHNYFLDLNIKPDFNSSAVYLEIKPPSQGNYDKNLWKETNIPKIIKMAEHWGAHSLSGTWEMRKTIEFAENLNKIVEKAHNATKHLTLEEQKTKISKLKNLHFTRIHWLEFLKNLTGLDSLTEDDVILLNLNAEEYFKDLYYLLQKTQVKFWVDYIVIFFLMDECRCLSKKIREPCKEMVYAGTKAPTRQLYCFDKAITYFDGIAEAQYIRKIVTEKKRKRIGEMIDNIKQEMEISLKKNKWMDQETKDASLEHLKRIKSAIGWTDIVYNETEFERLFAYNKDELPSDNIIEMRHKLNKHYLDYRFKKITEPFNIQIEHVLSVPELSVNAYYVRYWDVLILPGPILHRPVYDVNRMEYMNYGALGSIVGHELTHAFSEFDEENTDGFGKETLGNYTIDYWTNRTHQNFQAEKQCINEEYENYAMQLGMTVENSSASLDENLADFTRLNLAYTAYQKWVVRHGVENRLPGVKFTPNQLFWIMSSTYMCLEPKLKNPEKAFTDPLSQPAHKYALASFRVAGPIRNSPYFGDDFGCRPGTKMNPEKKCRLFE